MTDDIEKALFESRYTDGVPLLPAQWEMARFILRAEAASPLLYSGRGGGKAHLLRAIERYFRERAAGAEPFLTDDDARAIAYARMEAFARRTGGLGALSEPR